MQYVRSISGSVSKTWNSINPATLSGAIDVIVVEQDDGSLACSPFHVRFGKFSLLRPYEKKVEFRVNNEKQEYAMKLGEGGEAFFVFETTDNIPESLQTSPLVSPASSPPISRENTMEPLLQEPDFFDLDPDRSERPKSSGHTRPGPNALYPTSVPKRSSHLFALTPLSSSPENSDARPVSGDWSDVIPGKANTDEILPVTARLRSSTNTDIFEGERQTRSLTPSIAPTEGRSEPYINRSNSPPPIRTKEAIERAIALSKQLSASNIPSHVTDTGDLMLDMTGYKSSDDDALRAEVIARKILSEELEGNYDIGALIGADEHGNLWIYSSEEAKDAAAQRAAISGLASSAVLANDAASDPGYHSDADGDLANTPRLRAQRRANTSNETVGLVTPPRTPLDSGVAGDPNRNYAKTLRLTSDQLKALNLKAGPNPITFTVNRATCQAYMYLWKYDVPIVISDIDGTITKSDALGHVLNMIGRDWTHIGVAKLYTEIVANGYNIMYLTSRSTGQADNTRTYLNGVLQDGYKLPKGPTIMSPDRTIAALRRELYIRKPEVFKMACLRDIKGLFGSSRTPFYAGFGNRLTDALSYRSVSIPSNRIFTINSYAEVSLDLLSLNKLKLSYVNMREVVDHYFPPVGTLVKGGGEEFTDFTYWRDTPLDLDDFSASDSDGSADDDDGQSEDEGGEEYDDDGEMGDSYMSRDSVDESAEGDDNGGLSSSMIEAEDDLDGLDGGLATAAEEDITTKVLISPPSRASTSSVGFRRKDSAAELITGVKGLTLDSKLLATPNRKGPADDDDDAKSDDFSPVGIFN